MREEVRLLRDKGIELIPKLNFSATHHLWLGDYRRMLGLPKYYEVCRDLITEVANLFDHPRDPLCCRYRFSPAQPLQSPFPDSGIARGNCFQGEFHAAARPLRTNP